MAVFFLQHKNFMIAILALQFCSILCQIIIGVSYHRLIWESEHMSTTTDKSLQHLKLKFTGCCRLNEKVTNVPVFVDKYLSHIRYRGIPLAVLKHIAGQFVMLSVLVAGIGACLSIIHNESFLSVAPYYVVSFLGLYCYFAAASLIDAPVRQNILRINLVDYLENHLSSRLEQTALDMQLIQPDAKTPEKPQTPGPDTGQKNAPVFSAPEMEELELLLQEFLT